MTEGSCVALGRKVLQQEMCRVDARMSLEKSVILMELIGLVSFVMRGDLEFVGMERVEEMNLWSDIGV